MKKKTLTTAALFLAVCMAAAMLLIGCSNTAVPSQTPVPSITAEVSIPPEASTTPDVTATVGTDIPELTDEPEQTDAPAEVSAVEISFDYVRMSTHASNQIAIWVEAADGHLVKTVFVTDFTAARRGYENREDALSHWVTAAEPSAMSDSEIDAVSGPTPQADRLTYIWDLTDDDGNRIPDGVYHIIVEGTLYWSSNILYTAEIDLSNAAEGALPVSVIRSEPNNTQNDDMLCGVAVNVIMTTQAALTTGQSAEEQTLKLMINGTTVTVNWEDNESVAALTELVKNEPLTIPMSMYGGFEQVGSIGRSLPKNDAQTTTAPGDIVLYSGNQIVVFYGSNSWAYTRLGRIAGLDAAELSSLLGNEGVTLTLYFE